MCCKDCEFNFPYPYEKGKRVCANEYYGEIISDLEIKYGKNFSCRGFSRSINSLFGKEIFVEIND